MQVLAVRKFYGAIDIYEGVGTKIWSTARAVFCLDDRHDGGVSMLLHNYLNRVDSHGQPIPKKQDNRALRLSFLKNLAYAQVEGSWYVHALKPFSDKDLTRLLEA